MIQLRTARPTDAQPLSNLICENAAKTLRPHYTDEQWEAFIRCYTVTEITEKLKTQTIFCAEKDSLILGTIALSGDHIVGFYTRLGNINQGIGKKLMTHLEEYARNIGLTSLQLAASPEGLTFYLRTGWEKVKDIISVHYGVGYQETLMRKDLAP